MSLAIYNDAWPYVNGTRRYPLADFATGLDVTGTYRLPDSFLVGLYWPAPWQFGSDASRYYLRRVAVFPSGYMVTLGLDDGTADGVAVATAAIDRSAHAEGKGYALAGGGAFDDAVGQVAIGVLDDIDAGPAGVFEFDYAGGALDPDCVRPRLRGVTALYVENAGVRSGPIRGPVVLVAGASTQLTAGTDDAGPTIRVDYAGAPGLSACDCAGAATLGPPIRTINGVAPRTDGSFDLNPVRCIELTPIAHGLAIADTCSTPCCGCPELESLTAQLAHLGEEGASLRRFAERLRAEDDQFHTVALASRLADAPCVTP